MSAIDTAKAELIAFLQKEINTPTELVIIRKATLLLLHLKKLGVDINKIDIKDMIKVAGTDEYIKVDIEMLSNVKPILEVPPDPKELAVNYFDVRDYVVEHYKGWAYYDDVKKKLIDLAVHRGEMIKQVTGFLKKLELEQRIEVIKNDGKRLLRQWPQKTH